MNSIIKKIIKNYKTNKSLYIGEKVTMTEHMIQTAMLAEKNESSPSLVCASLLHDYGHFILEDPEKLVNQKKDGKHENVGYLFLKKYFNKNVVEPIKYHVKAKRYLASPVLPDCRLELNIEAIRSHGRVWKYKGEAMVDGKRMADAQWSATIVDRK